MRFPNHSNWPDWLAAGALGLMLTAPFLLAHHHVPLTAFYQEWWAAAFGLIASAFLLLRRFGHGLEIPELTLLPLGLLIIAGLQWLFAEAAIGSRLALFALYLLWAMLMLVLGRQLASTWGLARLMTALAWALLAGALLTALSGLLQLHGGIGLPWVFPHFPDTGVRGNLAQNNSFNHVLWLGIGAALYLRGQLLLARPLTAAAMMVLIVFSLFSGSRSTWLYAFGIATLGLWCAWRWPEQVEMRRLRRWSLAVLIGALVSQGLIVSDALAPLMQLVGADSGRRLVASGGDPMRLALWKAAWLTGRDHLWLGGGIGQYTWQFYLHVLDLMPTRLLAVPEHAHNIALHLFAEAGLPALLLLIVCAWRWLAPFLRQAWTPAYWYGAATLLVIALHSGLEYPLWYSFFLGPAALFAGALSPRNIVLRPTPALQPLMRPALALALLAGGIVLATLLRDYSTLEDAVNDRLGARTESERQQLYDEAVASLAGSPFRPYFDLVAAATQPETPENLAAKLDLCERAMRFSATRMMVFKCAHLQMLAGDREGARLSLRRAVAAYPAEAESILSQWQARAANEPALALLLADFPAIVPVAVRR